MSRDITYYANCDISDIIIYKLNKYEIINNEIIKISSSLYRKSDRKIMARLYVIKKRKIL